MHGLDSESWCGEDGPHDRRPSQLIMVGAMFANRAELLAQVPVTGGADPTPPQSRHVQVMGPPRHELHQRRSFPELRHMLCSAA